MRPHIMPKDRVVKCEGARKVPEAGGGREQEAVFRRDGGLLPSAELAEMIVSGGRRAPSVRLGFSSSRCPGLLWSGFHEKRKKIRLDSVNARDVRLKPAT